MVLNSSPLMCVHKAKVNPCVTVPFKRKGLLPLFFLVGGFVSKHQISAYLHCKWVLNVAFAKNSLCPRSGISHENRNLLSQPFQGVSRWRPSENQQRQDNLKNQSRHHDIPGNLKWNQRRDIVLSWWRIDEFHQVHMRGHVCPPWTDSWSTRGRREWKQQYHQVISAGLNSSVKHQPEWRQTLPRAESAKHICKQSCAIVLGIFSYPPTPGSEDKLRYLFNWRAIFSCDSVSWNLFSLFDRQLFESTQTESRIPKAEKTMTAMFFSTLWFKAQTTKAPAAKVNTTVPTGFIHVEWWLKRRISFHCQLRYTLSSDMSEESISAPPCTRCLQLNFRWFQVKNKSR